MSLVRKKLHTCGVQKQIYKNRPQSGYNVYVRANVLVATQKSVRMRYDDNMMPTYFCHPFSANRWSDISSLRVREKVREKEQRGIRAATTTTGEDTERDDDDISQNQ